MSSADRHQPSAEQPRAMVLYDRDCGFCRWSLGAILVWDRRHRLSPVALQSPEARRALGNLSAEERMASAHLVTPDGRVHSGGEAVAPLLRLLPGGAPASRAAEMLPGAATHGYEWVARHRGALGRRLPRELVRRATERIAARD